MSKETRHVRLKAYDPRAGFVLKGYAVNVGRKLPARFDAGKWYEVPAVMAKYLATIRERPGVATSPLAFDVCKDAAEARELVRREEAEKARGKKPEDAVNLAADLTTGDLSDPKPAAIIDQPDPGVDLTSPDLDTEEDEEEEEPEPPPPRATRKRTPKAKTTPVKVRGPKPKPKPKGKGKAKAKAKSKRKR